MSKEISTISPEGLEVANCYLQFGNIKVVELINKREVKRYIDTVYLDLGYRNKNNIGSLLDEMIQSKLEEAQETGVYSSKDLADLLQMAHHAHLKILDDDRAAWKIVQHHSMPPGCPDAA